MSTVPSNIFAGPMDDAGAMLQGRTTYETMESAWRAIARDEPDRDSRVSSLGRLLPAASYRADSIQLRDRLAIKKPARDARRGGSGRPFSYLWELAPGG